MYFYLTFEKVDTWDEDEKSEIYFNLTDQYEENSGMELCSTKDGHFINVIDIESKYPPIMNLRYVGFQIVLFYYYT